MFFDRWSDVVRVVVLGALAYAVMVVVLRISGKRTLAKLNAFDDGSFDAAALSQARLTRGEVCQAIRSSGCGDLEMVAAVVLETDGSLSVVTADRCHTASAMPATAFSTKQTTRE